MKIEFCPEDPCLGLECPRANKWAGYQTMGMSYFFDQEPDGDNPVFARSHLGQMLGICYATDRDGVKRVMSDAEFEIHALNHEGRPGYVAVYSGDVPPEELLVASPEWTEELLPDLIRAASELVA